MALVRGRGRGHIEARSHAIKTEWRNKSRQLQFDRFSADVATMSHRRGADDATP